MKKFVLQWRKFPFNPWEFVEGREYDTLAEAQEAYKALPDKVPYRIAERYVVVRYREAPLPSTVTVKCN